MLTIDPARFERFVRAKRNRAVYLPDGRMPISPMAELTMESIKAHLSEHPCPVDSNGRVCRVTGGLVDDEQVNAFAADFDEHFFVGLNTGLIDEVVHVAAICFLKLNAFPELGTLKTKSPPDLRVRASAVQYVTLLMLRFAWMHEVGHCIGGHIALLKSLGGEKGGFDELSLIELSGDERMNPDERRYLEVEADMWALRECLWILMLGRENLDVPPELEDSEIMQLMLFAAYAVTWVQENAKPLIPGETHPTPYGRLTTFYLLAEMTLTPDIPAFAVLNRFALQQLRGIARRLDQNWMQDMGGVIESYNAVGPAMRKRLEPYRYAFSA